MKIFGFLKKYTKYLFGTVLSAIFFIFTLPLIPTVNAIISGYSPSTAYILSGLFMIGLTSNFYYCILLTPIILIRLEKLNFKSKPNAKVLPVLVLPIVFSIIGGTSFLFFSTQPMFKDNWKSRIQAAQFSSKDKQKEIAAEFGTHIKGQLNLEDKNLKEALAEIDRVSKEANFKLATDYKFVKRGYIAYYFKSTKTGDLESIKTKTIQIFKDSHIGPTFYWLNMDWYNDFIKDTRYKSNLSQLIDIQNDLIVIKYETLFPLLNDFVYEGVLNIPPPHILKAAKKSGLKFIKSERRDSIDYFYSVPVSLFKFLGGNFNLRYILWGIRSKEGYNEVSLQDVECVWPRYDIKNPAAGYSPSTKIDYPPMPFEIPSCGEYETWVRCQKGGTSQSCGSKQYRKGAPEPACAPPDVTFPKEKYRTF